MTRVVYSRLAPRKADFDMVRDLMLETKILDRSIDFSQYADTRFADGAVTQTAWDFGAGRAGAK